MNGQRVLPNKNNENKSVPFYLVGGALSDFANIYRRNRTNLNIQPYDIENALRSAYMQVLPLLLLSLPVEFGGLRNEIRLFNAKYRAYSQRPAGSVNIADETTLIDDFNHLSSRIYSDFQKIERRYSRMLTSGQLADLKNTVDSRRIELESMKKDLIAGVDDNLIAEYNNLNALAAMCSEWSYIGTVFARINYPNVLAIAGKKIIDDANLATRNQQNIIDFEKSKDTVYMILTRQQAVGISGYGYRKKRGVGELDEDKIAEILFLGKEKEIDIDNETLTQTQIEVGNFDVDNTTEVKFISLPIPTTKPTNGSTPTIKIMATAPVEKDVLQVKEEEVLFAPKEPTIEIALEKQAVDSQNKPVTEAPKETTLAVDVATNTVIQIAADSTEKPVTKAIVDMSTGKDIAKTTLDSNGTPVAVVVTNADGKPATVVAPNTGKEYAVVDTSKVPPTIKDEKVIAASTVQANGLTTAQNAQNAQTKTQDKGTLQAKTDDAEFNKKLMYAGIGVVALIAIKVLVK